MGIFDKLFSGNPKEKKEEKVLPWIPLTSIPQLDMIEKRSNEKLQVIFKHSTRCGISRMVINQFVDSYDFTEEEVDLYYLDLLNHRDVSNEIAAKFQVWHESPQMIVLKGGHVVHHASHSGIQAASIQQVI